MNVESILNQALKIYQLPEDPQGTVLFCLLCIASILSAWMVGFCIIQMLFKNLNKIVLLQKIMVAVFSFILSIVFIVLAVCQKSNTNKANELARRDMLNHDSEAMEMYMKLKESLEYFERNMPYNKKVIINVRVKNHQMTDEYKENNINAE